MPSYFLIMPLPDEVRDRLVAVQPYDLPGASLAGRQEMHLTLYSLGELSPRYDEAIRKALAQVKANAFMITVSGVGRFQLEGKPQVLWAWRRAEKRLQFRAGSGPRWRVSFGHDPCLILLAGSS